MFRRLKFAVLALIVVVAFAQPFLWYVPVRAVAPADCYWVGGTGNWSDSTNHWAISSGGSPGVGNLPDATSNVHFDANSNIGTQNVTVTLSDPTTSNNCNNLDFTGIDGLYTLYYYGSATSVLNVYGNVTLNSSVTVNFTYSSGYQDLALMGTTKTFTCGGASVAGGIYVTGSYTLLDSLVTGNIDTSGSGSLNTNGQTITISRLNIGAGQTLTLGASVVNISYSLVVYAGATLNANTSSIRLTGSASFSGGGKTYYEVQLNGTSHTVSDANTFTTLTRTGTATLTGSLILSANQTVSGTLTLNGNSAVNRLLVTSDTLGTSRILTAATVSSSNSDFRDITGAGVGSWDLSSGSSGNCGGNTNITFTTTTTSYWVGNTGNYSDVANHWASSSNGTPGTGRMPLPQDTVRLDSNSFTLASRILTLDSPRVGNFNTYGVLYNPTLSGSGTEHYGNNIYLGNVTYTGSALFYYRGNLSLATNYTTLGSLSFYQIGGTITLQDQLTSSGTLYVYAGTFNTNNYPVNASTIDSYSATYTRGITLGSSTVTLTGAGEAWRVQASGFTLSSGTSTIVISGSDTSARTFTGAGLYYNNLTIQGTASFSTTIGGSNTFNTITVTRSQAAKTLLITSASTQTISQLTIPVVGTTVVTIGATSTSAGTISQSSGIVASDYLSISYSTATGGATFFAGSHSTNGGNNTGWTFTDASLPVVSTLAASGITLSNATLNGSISNMGGIVTVYAFFQYGLTGTYGTNTAEQTFTSAQAFSQAISGLAVDTLYHYRAALRYSGATYVYGADTTFTSVGSPTVVTGSALNVTASSATLQANISDMGVYSSVIVFFQYGLTDSYGTQTVNQQLSSATIFGQGITSLSAGTTYHFRAVVSYSSPPSYKFGLDNTFTTSSYGQPVVVTGTATNISMSGATLQGTLTNIGDYPTVYVSFDYGLTISYGSGTQDQTVTSLTAFNATISGLALDTTYHFRARVRYGTSSWVYGSDATFATLTSSGAGTNIQITRGIVLGHYKQDGDLLFLAETRCSYPPYYPYESAKRYFVVQLLDTDGATVLASVPLHNWGCMPVSIYLNLTVAGALPHGQQVQYYLKLVGTFPTPPSSQYQLQTADWQGDVGKNLDVWCLATAVRMQNYDNKTGYVKASADKGLTIEDPCAGYFTDGIPCISEVRPNLFSSSRSGVVLDTGTANNQWDTTHPWATQVGSVVGADATTFGSLFSIDGRTLLGWGIVAVALIFMLIGLTSGGKVLDLFVLAVPLFLLGNYLGVIDIQVTLLWAFGSMFFFVMYVWLRGT